VGIVEEFPHQSVAESSEQFLKPSEVAKILRRSTVWMRQQSRKGVLPSYVFPDWAACVSIVCIG
jgi:hypothetical protein